MANQDSSGTGGAGEGVGESVDDDVGQAVLVDGAVGVGDEGDDVGFRLVVWVDAAVGVGEGEDVGVVVVEAEQGLIIAGSNVNPTL